MPSITLQTQVNVFNGRMERSFAKAIRVQGEPAPFEAFTSIKPANARIMQMPFMGPTGGMKIYQGRRDFNRVDPNLFSAVMYEFYDGMTVELRDVEDDQLDLYPIKMQEMVLQGGRLHDSHEVFKLLAKGTSIPCFDQTNYFASSHTLGGFATAVLPTTGGVAFGGGGNNLTYTAAGSSDGLTYQLIMFVTDNMQYKPIVLWDRKPLKFNTDAGTPDSFERKKIDYWLDKEIGLSMTFWYDGLRVVITNSPDLNDLKNIFDGMETWLKQFLLPSVEGEAPRYAHGQKKFSPSNLTLCTGTKLYRRVSHLLDEKSISVTPAMTNGGIVNNNIFFGAYKFVSANELDL